MSSSDQSLSPSSQSLIPAERAFQIDPNGLGGIAESVNLFRGDVNIPVNLVSLTSRSGIDASLTLVYNSNIGKQIDIWNLQAPTGPVGLGWSAGYEFIARDPALTSKPIEGECFLIAGGSSNRLFRTVIAADYWEYEAENYQFWRIRYFPATENWEITQEDGTRRLYGARGADKSAVQYGIKWPGPLGNWTDATVVTSDQSLYPIGWNLTEIAPPWGDGVLMEYENSTASIGGDSGLLYTISSRLKKVIVPMVRALVFHYLPKRYDTEIREYQIPHVNAGAPLLRAYQDHTDTLFLDRVEVRNAEDAPSAPGAIIQHVGFQYALVNMARDRLNDPDYFKRYLTGVNYTTPDGLSLPNMRFFYYNDPIADAGSQFNRGALKRVLYPQGGSISYTYSQTSLSGTNRASAVETRGTPRVWFGPDYTVVVNYEGRQSGLTIRIFSWNGQWVEAPTSYSLAQDLDLATLEVSTQPECFAVACQTQGPNVNLMVLLFHKQKGRYGQWIGQQSYDVLPVQNGKQGLLATGTDFAIALTSGASLMVKVWDERTGTWLNRKNAVKISPNRSYALAATADYIALASADTSAHRADLNIWYRLRESGDFAEAKIDVSTLNDVDWQPDSTPAAFWSLASQFASMTFVNGGDDKIIRYTLKVLQWDESFYARTVLSEPYKVDATTKLPYAQSVVSGSVLGNTANLFRYDGRDWPVGILPTPTGDSDPPRFVYGSDLAIVSGKTSAAIAVFDPYKIKWDAAIEIPISQLGIVPTASGNYITVDRQVYYRDPTNTLKPVYVLDSNMNPASFVNRAPYFIAYEDQSGNTHVLPVANGTVDSANEKVLKNERIYVNDGGSGTSLVGPASLLTYQGSFDNPSSLRLYQFVNNEIEGTIVSYPVQALSIDDGYPDAWGVTGQTPGSKSTRFYYDCDTVTVSPDGSVTEFAAATAVYGAGPDSGSVLYPPPDATLFGRSEYRYHNNRSPRTGRLVPRDEMLDPSVFFYSYLDGMLFDKIDYDAEGVPVERVFNIYEVSTQHASIDDQNTLLRLIGGYVRRTDTEISQYEQSIRIDDSGALTVDSETTSIPSALRRAYADRAIELKPGALLVADKSGTRWRVYPDPKKPRFFPVAKKTNGFTASVAVSRHVGSVYSKQTGLVTSEYTGNYNSNGLPETLTRQIYYAWQIAEYASFKDLHIWSSVGASIKFWQQQGMATPGDPQAMSVNTYARWVPAKTGGAGTWAPKRNFTASDANAYDASRTVPVRFDAWDNQSEPPLDLWRSSGEVIRRSVGGSTLEARDPFGKATTVILNATGTARIAEFSNSTTVENLYTGFESYEDLARWSLNGQAVPQASLLRGDAHTGMQALRLAAEPNAVLATALTLNQGVRYILACWIKTDSSFNAGAGKAQWFVSAGGNALAVFDIEGSDGQWAYRHYVITLAGSATQEVILKLINAKTQAAHALLIDDVMLSPLIGGANASVYDEIYGDVIAAVNLNGNINRTLYDSRGRSAVQIGVTGQVESVAVTYLVREKDLGDAFVFPSERPNAIATIEAQTGGAFADLVQGQQWKTQWEIGDDTAWTTTNGVLVHVRNGQDRITFRPTQDLDDYAIRVSSHLRLKADGKPVLPTQPIGLDIGTAVGIRWNPTVGWSLSLLGTSHSLDALDFASEWTLMMPKDSVSGQTAVLFYADGELLFSQLDTPALSGAATLIVADVDIGFSAIAVLRSPTLAATFLDGSGKERQQQSFTGSGSIVSGSLYDPIGRAAIGVKPVERVGHAPQYDAGYVTRFDATTGVMTGDAATAYPEDEGYPYVRTEFARTAQSLAVRQGAPGKQLAIIYTAPQGDTGADLSNPHIQQFRYGTNVEGQFGGDHWPSNQYFVKAVIDANANETLTLTTQVDQPLASISSPVDGVYQVFQYFYDGSGRLIKSLPPAGVLAAQAGDANADAWATTMTYNFLGEGIVSSDPNSGQTQTIYGLGGQVRFVMDADGAATSPNRIRYSKYDAIGREIESGTFAANFDRAQLQQIALTDPAWPGAAQNPAITKVFQFDGDGTNPTLFGRMIQSINYAASSKESVVQDFAYHQSGQLLAQVQTAGAFDSTRRRVAYGYDNVGNLLQVTYPDASDILNITYAYTRLGQIHTIGTPQEPNAIANFSYNAAGQVQSSTVNVSSAASLVTLAKYGPPGWLETSTTTVAGAALLSETLTYTQGGYQGASYFDGKIASVQLDDNQGSQAHQYAYDAVSRLSASEMVTGSNTVTHALTYDVNGNLKSLTANGVTSSYDYAANNDQLETVKSGGSVIDAYRYNADGNAVSADRRGLSNIAYDASTGLTTQMDMKDGRQLRFAYDASNARTLKKMTNSLGDEISAQLYVRNESGAPLLEIGRSASGGATNRQYLYGPSGLIGMQMGGKRFAVVRDHLGSVRQVVDESGTVVAIYDYTDFGITVTRPGSSQPGIIYYLYTGQELDSESGLYNYQARFYDPELGRFVATDPKRQGASPYVYVLNNPIGMVDPDGEEALTAFLIAVIVSAIIGAIVGGITYAVTHEGNFDVGKFFLYAAAGLVAGAAGGAAAFGGGLLATAALGAVGISTSTSIGSGIVIGAVAGAADGAVAGTINQAGVNLIEKRPLTEGLGQAAWMGAAIGGAAGAVLGGVTGAINYRTANKLTNPSRVITNRPSGQTYAASKGAATYGYDQIGNAAGGTARQDVVGMVAHGGPNVQTLRFVDQPVAVASPGTARQNVGDVAAALGGRNFTGGGIDLGGVCSAGNSGVARTLARDLQVPVRAATGTTVTASGPMRYFNRTLAAGEHLIRISDSLKGVAFRTYYPSQLRTGWNYLFGY